MVSCVVCVCVSVSSGVLTHSLCCPSALLSPHLPPVATDIGLPVAAHTRTRKRSVSAPVCTNWQWVAVLAASSQRGPLCFTSGLDSRQTIWESLTGSLNEVIEWGVYSCAVYFLYFFFCEVVYCFLFQCSFTQINVTVLVRSFLLYE